MSLGLWEFFWPRVVAKKLSRLSFKQQRRPLWRFFRPKHLAPNPGQPLSGAGTYALPYVTRRLRIPRPRHLFVPVAAVAPPAAVVYKRRLFDHLRQKRPLWRFFRPRHLPATIPAPLVRKPVSKWLPKRRPLWRFFRPKHLFVLAAAAPPPAAVVYKRLQRLRFRRPLWRYFRPKHLFAGPTAPPSGAGTYALAYVSRRLRIFARPRHVFVPFVAPPPTLVVYKRPQRRYRFRRPLWRYSRPKHLFGIGTAVQPSSLSWKRPKRGTARKRPLWRFFRPRHVLGYTPAIAPPLTPLNYPTPTPQYGQTKRLIDDYWDNSRHRLPEKFY